jgi:hypothetical protein
LVISQTPLMLVSQVEKAVQKRKKKKGNWGMGKKI